jgi:hypothetical protein
VIALVPRSRADAAAPIRPVGGSGRDTVTGGPGADTFPRRERGSEVIDLLTEDAVR